MKKIYPEIFFEKRGGSGSLSIYWSEGPFGNSIEANKGNGIGFADENGKIIAVQFDHVKEENDRQTLLFSNNLKIEVTIKKGKVKVTRVHPSSRKKAA